MKINMTGFGYQLDDNGNTTAVNVVYSGFDGTAGNFNSTVNITQADMKEGTTLDDLGRKDFDVMAREKMKAWIDEV